MEMKSGRRGVDSVFCLCVVLVILLLFTHFNSIDLEAKTSMAVATPVAAIFVCNQRLSMDG